MRRIFPPLVACALVACPPKAEGPDAGAAGPREVPEAEPNDSADRAMAVGPGTRVAASLGAEAARPDQDWYRLGPSPQALRLEISGIPGADVQAELLDQDQNRIVGFNSTGEGSAEVIPNLTPRTPHLLKVSAARRGSGGAYTLTVVPSSLPESGAEVEPNHRAVDATPVTPGVPILGVIGDGADEDWFRIDLGEPDAGAVEGTPDAGAAGEVPQVARVELTGVEGVRLEASILTSAEAPLYTGRGHELGDGVQIRSVALRPGDPVLYVVVRSAWEKARRPFNPDVPYTLTVAVEAGAGDLEAEPNDDAAHATPLGPGAPKRGFLAPKGDVDYFAVHVDAPSLLRVDLSGVDRVDLVLSVVRPPAEGQEKDTVLLSANDGTVKEGEVLVNVAAASGAVIKVEGGARKVDHRWVRDFENPNEPYRLVVTARPDDGSDEREPNNAAADATPIVPRRPMRGVVHPRRDVDLYRLDLTSAAVKTPLKITATGILKVDIGLSLHRIEGDKAVLVQSADKAKGDLAETLRYPAEPGAYLIEVRDAKNRESNFQDAYRVTVEIE